MSDEHALTKWDSPQGRYAPVPGTEDWVHVVTLDDGGGWDWAILGAYYSPSARRYFWSGSCGCSCHDWSEDLNSPEDFENGSRDDLCRAITSFADEFQFRFSASDAIDAISTVKTFKEPK